MLEMDQSGVAAAMEVLQKLNDAGLDFNLRERLPAVTYESIRLAVDRTGLVPLEELGILASIVDTLKPQRSIEIGLASGSSALTILATAGTQHLSHIAVDPLQVCHYQSQAIDLIKRIGAFQRFELIEEYSYVAMPRLLSKLGSVIDFAYLDGSHLYDHTLLEWFYADKMLKVGGVICFDDCDWAAVRSITNFIETNTSYKILKPSNRTFVAVKLSNDVRHWYDFMPFDVPWNDHYAKMIDDHRNEAG